MWSDRSGAVNNDSGKGTGCLANAGNYPPDRGALARILP